jgi:hypothetical protein
MLRFFSNFVAYYDFFIDFLKFNHFSVIIFQITRSFNINNPKILFFFPQQAFFIVLIDSLNLLRYSMHTLALLYFVALLTIQVALFNVFFLYRSFRLFSLLTVIIIIFLEIYYNKCCIFLVIVSILIKWANSRLRFKFIQFKSITP